MSKAAQHAKVTVGRQARSSEKRPLMVYLPADLREFLETCKLESGLSGSAYMVLLLRREKRSMKNVSDSVA